MIRVLIIILGLCIVSCSPYKTFYKKTYTANDDLLNNKVYRITINSNDEANSMPLASLHKLASIKFINTSFKDIDNVFKKIPNPEKLKVLILDSLGLKSLPNSISRFKNLSQIALNSNPELDFDSTFKILKDLPIVFFNLQDNKLTQIPESITEFNTLKDLNLSNNSISKEENFSTLTQLPKLTSLWLTNNNLKVLPKTIGALSRLKNLYIEHNQLTNLPSEISGMKKVWVVHAGHNLFEELPPEFATMKGLFLLHVNNCKIKSIPEIYSTKASHVLGLIMDNNNLSDSEKAKWKKEMRHYFLLSLE